MLPPGPSGPPSLVQIEHRLQARRKDAPYGFPMNRRGFLCLLTAVPAAIVVPKFFLPPKGGWPAPRLAMSTYLTSKERWFYNNFGHRLDLAPIKPEGGVIAYDDGVALTSAPHPGSEAVTKEEVEFIEAGGWTCAKGHPYCNCCPGPALSEASLERLCIDIKQMTDDRGIKMAIEPTHFRFRRA